MGADRRQKDRPGVRLGDRTAGRHGIAGGPRRGRDDQPVAGEGEHLFPVRPGGRLDAFAVAVDHDVVEGVVVQDRLSASQQRDLQHHPLAHGNAGLKRLYDSGQLFRLHAGHEALGPQVHAEDRDLGPVEFAHHRQNRSVAAQNHHVGQLSQDLADRADLHILRRPPVRPGEHGTDTGLVSGRGKKSAAFKGSEETCVTKRIRAERYHCFPPCAASTTALMSNSGSSRRSLTSQVRNSMFPSGPRIGDQSSPITL